MQRKVLIIDDSTSSRELVISLLKNSHSEFYQARTAEEGFDVLGKTAIDLIITDLDLSGISGIELCEIIRKTPSFRGIPVIILSVYDSESKIEAGFKAGAEAYISKNTIQQTLGKIFHQVMSKYKFQRGKRILIADDSDSIRNMVVSGLCEAGFDVDCAVNGKEAIDMLQSEHYDLFLSDIEMPEINGFQLLNLIQGDSDLVHMPVVVMSTHDERSYIKRIILQGAVSYLVKPFNIDQLVIMVERVLSDQFVLLRKEKERAELERNMMLASITSLISALEARDYYTRGHSDAVSTITVGMLEIFGATEKQLYTLGIAGKLHDIGKIGVRDSVLMKPGKLTAEEFDHIKEHPVKGAEILNSIPSLYNVLPVVEHHHERIDGKGYPDGLKGKEIPFWARITSVADTFHAITSDRPYRKGMDHESALQIIKDVSGTQLCPQCVELFFEWLKLGTWTG